MNKEEAPWWLLMIKAITTAHDKQHTVFCLFDTVKLPKKLNVCLPAGCDIIQFYSLHQHHRHYIHDTEYNSGLVSVGVGTPNSNILHISHYFFFKAMQLSYLITHQKKKFLLLHKP